MNLSKHRINSHFYIYTFFFTKIILSKIYTKCNFTLLYKKHNNMRSIQFLHEKENYMGKDQHDVFRAKIRH